MKDTLFHANQWLEWDWKVPPLITAWAPYEHILTVIATNLKGQNLMVLYAQCTYKTVILWDLNQMITIIRLCPCGVIFANLERDLLVSPWPTDWHEIPFTIPKKKKKNPDWHEMIWAPWQGSQLVLDRFVAKHWKSKLEYRPWQHLFVEMVLMVD